MPSITVDSAQKFDFVQSLATHLSNGSIELPSFPDVVIRLRQVVEDDQSTQDQIVKLLEAEPALAARLLQIANSAALRPGTSEVSDIKMAVNRLGRNMVRNSAMSFAVKQMRETQKLAAAQSHLTELWRESTRVAALCYVLAKQFTKLNPDEALLAGLLHGIGKLYILSQAEMHPELFGSESGLEDILRDWHAAIGGAILESWRFSKEISNSVANYQDVNREHEGPVDLTDILTVAYLLAVFLQGETDTELQLDDLPASRHLAVSAENFISILHESEEHIASLRQALG